MSMIHVVEVRFRVGGDESLDHRMSNLITLVHRAAQGRKFAVGLPGYRNDAQPVLGKCLQIFSFEGSETIEVVLSDRRLSTYIMDWCEIGSVREVQNDEITDWVVFRKSQIAKKGSPSHQRRAERRKQDGKRTQQYSGSESSRAQTSRKRLPCFLHYSQRNDMEVPLYIERASGLRDAKQVFDSFGLALIGSCGVPTLVGNRE